MTLLVRFARRQASWEGERSAEELQQLEFRKSDGSPDLHPSVYLIADQAPVVTQTYAEHSATPPIKPERSTIGIDTVGCADEVRTIDGSPRFAFVRAAHREFAIKDLPSLLAFVASLQERVRASRCRVVTREQVVAYARTRIAAQDPEWIAVAKLAENDWLKALRRLIPEERE